MKKYIKCNIVSLDDMDSHIGSIFKDYLPIDCDDKSDMIYVTQKMVDSFIKNIEVFTVGQKTTIVKATLVNNFEIVESSSCVEQSMYDEEVGKNICIEKIKDKIWYLLGFLCCSSKYGFNDKMQ